ncbi:MAG TPA: sugar phosphate isomerase/epimerase [Phenylobacterium sp.]|jgi:sugar phosphate isomerase/epimerase|uniref:sugar phosphate isomerase/epimerase family protein n=1 Tax=Phenylobacterium sp. TaxID=1871053 RepID=UPI002C223C81|nr:sugar phosphate isomerase/epimerase [Phenylobacterium sp.]HXA39887.1 sugar phosphate isomerase/epimerase [Phenylobacterium sp.]
MIPVSRRTALGAGLAAAASSLAAGASARTPREPFFKGNGLPIGLQLYTLGGDLRADVDGMLGQVAKIGYRTVEMAGYLGRTPAELRAAFDKAGLRCTSSHVQARPSGPEPSLADVDRLIADAKVIGIEHIVLPMFAIPDHIDMKPRPGEDRATVMDRLAAQIAADDWKATAELLNAKGRALKAAGLTLGYHNHNVEFAPVGGTTGLEILLKGTDPALVSFEMDVGWVVAAGHDPFALLKAHAGRFKQMHVKDVKASTKPNFAFRQDPTEVGSGIIPWKRLLPAAYAEGVRGFFVEQEPPFERPRIEAARLCFDYLNAVVA